MPQVHLYVAELLEAVRLAMGARNRAIPIWNHYWIRLSEGGLLQVLRDRFEEVGKMTLSDHGDSVFFSKLLTIEGYEKQGIGTLVVLLGVLYGTVVGKRYARLGETDTNAVKGGHFWGNLGLSEAYADIHSTLRKILEEQAVLARKLGLALDPGAVLVALNPTKSVQQAGTKKRSNSFGGL